LTTILTQVAATAQLDADTELDQPPRFSEAALPPLFAPDLFLSVAWMFPSTIPICSFLPSVGW
jgi:hypothetical protein